MDSHAAWFMALGAACGTTTALILGLNGREGRAHKNAPRTPVLAAVAFTGFNAAAALLGGAENPVAYFAFGTNLGYGLLFGWRTRLLPFGGKIIEKIVHVLGAALAMLSTVGLLEIIWLLIITPRGAG